MGKPNRPTGSKSQRATPKQYEKPTLTKGPVLTVVTASDGAPVSGATGFCWIARAAFGESDIRWMIFRAWLLEDAPTWFRRLYIRYGETIGAWLGGHGGARHAVRKLMTLAINRKLRE